MKLIESSFLDRCKFRDNFLYDYFVGDLSTSFSLFFVNSRGKTEGVKGFLVFVVLKGCNSRVQLGKSRQGTEIGETGYDHIVIIALPVDFLRDVSFKLR